MSEYTIEDLLKAADIFKKLHKKSTSYIRGRSRVFISDAEMDRRFDAERVLRTKGGEMASLIAELAEKVRDTDAELAAAQEKIKELEHINKLGQKRIANLCDAWQEEDRQRENADG